MTQKITVIRGDGIGPEIMDATLFVLDQLKTGLEYEDADAGLVGGLGLAPGANIGKDAAIFEAVHGTAPDIAGQGKANPCALLLAAAQMLDHIGQPENAERLRTAIVATMEAKDSLTGDLGGTGTTMSFAQAIASRL